MKNFRGVMLMICSFLLLETHAQIPEGTKAAPTNIRPDDCHCIFPDLRVLFKVNAQRRFFTNISLTKQL
jgi:hypothetical protein